MLKTSVRPRFLPRAAWRAVFLSLALASAGTQLPLVSRVEAASSTAPAASKAAAGQKNLTAAQLVRQVRAGVALVGKGAKDGKVDPKGKAAAPFFATVSTIARNADKLEKQLAAKDPAYFKTLSETATAVGKLRVTGPRMGVANRTINDGVKVIVDSFDTLRSSFGKEAARRKQGGSLTAQERATFAKLKAQQRDATANLKKLRAQAQRDGNKKLAADLSGLIRQSGAVLGAKETLDGFLGVLEVMDYLFGLYDAYSYYVPASYRDGWRTVKGNVGVAAPIYWEYYDTYPVSDWTYYETADVSYEYSYAWEETIAESEIEAFEDFVEETSSDEEPFEDEDFYVDEDEYDDTLEENEEEQDDSWEDIDEDLEADDAEEEADDAEEEADDAEDEADEADDAEDEADDAEDEADDAEDEADDAEDEADDAEDEADDAEDEADDAEDEADDAEDEADDAEDEADDAEDEADDAEDEADDAEDEADDGGDEGGDEE